MSKFEACDNKKLERKMTAETTVLAGNDINSINDAFIQLAKIANEYLKPTHNEVTYSSFIKAFENQLLSIKYSSSILI
jgi:hypothetical protein